MSKKKYDVKPIEDVLIVVFIQGRGDKSRRIVLYMDKTTFETLKKLGTKDGYFDVRKNGTRTEYVRYFDGNRYHSVHDVALGFSIYESKGHFVDHINHCTYDCRRENLRIVTRRENRINSKIKGVSYLRKGIKRFKVVIGDSSKQFYTEPEALLYRREQELLQFGNYSYNPLNDFRDHIDWLEAIIKKEKSKGFITAQLLSELAQNPWKIYRYNLLQLLKNYGINLPNYNINDEGFIVDQAGVRFSSRWKL